MILFNEAKFLIKCIYLLKDKEELLVRDLYKEYLNHSNKSISNLLSCNPKIFSKLTSIICDRHHISLSKTIPWKISLSKLMQEEIFKKYDSKTKEDIFQNYGIHFNSVFYRNISSKEFIPLENDLDEHQKVLNFCIPRDNQAIRFFKKNRKNNEDVIYFIYAVYPYLNIAEDNIEIIDDEEEGKLNKDYAFNGKQKPNMSSIDDYYLKQTYVPEWDEECDSVPDFGYRDDADYVE